MTYPRPTEPESRFDRVVRFVTDPGRRIGAFIVISYVAAGLGLGVAFLGGINRPNSELATLGILLLFVSFVSLFYVSVTVINLEHGD